MIAEYWALIATYCDEDTALLLSQRCGTIQIKHTYKDKFGDTITTINGVKTYRVTSNGYQMWYKDGQLHREDGPAVIYRYGYQEWRREGKLHREDPVGPPSGYGPAVIWSNGRKIWYKHGKRHREGGPAVINPNGTQEWYKNGKRYKWSLRGQKWD